MYGEKGGHISSFEAGDDREDRPPEGASAGVARGAEADEAVDPSEDRSNLFAHQALVPRGQTGATPVLDVADHPRQRRRTAKKLGALLVVLLLLGGGSWYGRYWWTTGRYLVSTDDAY